MKTLPKLNSSSIEITKIILVVCVVSYLLFACVGFENTILGHHSFRQTQTALNVESLLEDWDVFGYRLPIEGPPWRQPYEFPVYQFITAVTVRFSGLSLISAGRTVSIVAFLLSGFIFYRLMLLFLGSRKESILCVSLFFLVPFYRFWSRSFMIETTALLFSLSWIYATLKAFNLKTIWWICLASILGVIAGLAKSTTYFVALDFVFLSVVFGLFDSGFRWNLLFSSAGWKYITGQLLPIIILTVGFPVITAISWTKVSDLLKSDNYFSAMSSSKVLTSWNFGTLEQRIDFETWKRFFEHIELGFFNPFFVFVLLLLGFVFAEGKMRKLAAVCILSFVVPLLVFTNLYFVHDYYFTASAVFLLMAICALGIGIFRSFRRFGYLYFVTTILLFGFQFHSGYLRTQITNFEYLKYLSVYLKNTVKEDELLLVLGYYGGCNPELPFYAKRRAIMINNHTFPIAQELKVVMSRFRQERIGAVVCCGNYFDEDEWILDFLEAEGFSIRPSFVEGRLWKTFLREGQFQPFDQ